MKKFKERSQKNNKHFNKNQGLNKNNRVNQIELEQIYKNKEPMNKKKR